LTVLLSLRLCHILNRERNQLVFRKSHPKKIWRHFARRFQGWQMEFWLQSLESDFHRATRAEGILLSRPPRWEAGFNSSLKAGRSYYRPHGVGRSVLGVSAALPLTAQRNGQPFRQAPGAESVEWPVLFFSDSLGTPNVGGDPSRHSADSLR
jgi:hypothetical protein